MTKDRLVRAISLYEIYRESKHFWGYGRIVITNAKRERERESHLFSYTLSNTVARCETPTRTTLKAPAFHASRRLRSRLSFQERNYQRSVPLPFPHHLKGIQSVPSRRRRTPVPPPLLFLFPSRLPFIYFSFFFCRSKLTIFLRIVVTLLQEYWYSFNGRSIIQRRLNLISKVSELYTDTRVCKK